MSQENKSLHDLYTVLAAADEAYNNLPPDAQVLVQGISKSLRDHGCRGLNHRGHGMDFHQVREFNPHTDERRRINRRISQKAGRDMVVDRQIEVPHHVYIWIDPSKTMLYPHGKRVSAEIMALGLAKHLVRNEDAIGVLGHGKKFRNAKSIAGIGNQIMNVSMLTGNIPSPGRKLPRDSTVVLFSDFAAFIGNHDALDDSLDHIVGQGLNGHIIMTLTPEEVDFNFRGQHDFHSIDQKVKIKGRAESLRDIFRQSLHNHIEWVRKTGAKHGLDFTLQRTDKPLHEGLLRVFGLGQEYTPIITSENPMPGPS